MKQKNYEILKKIEDNHLTNIKMLALALNESIPKIEKKIKELIENDYLNQDLSLTNKTKEEIKEKQPRNAIIIADELGMGMFTVEKKLPIGLLQKDGEVVIERLLKQLHEANIKDITIIVGFSGEQYDYLIDKYDVQLIYNENHASKASLYSLELVKDKLSNTYIIPSNIYAEINPFSTTEFYSWYSVSDTMDDSSMIRYKPPYGLIKVEEDKGGNSIVGLSYLLDQDAKKLLKNIQTISEKKSRKDQDWEQALFDSRGKMYVYPQVFSSTQVYPLRDYDKLTELETKNDKIDNEIIQLISNKLKVQPQDIHDIHVLESGKTNRSFRFAANEKQYIMRIPGEGTGELVNRAYEYKIYNLLKGREISDETIYMSPENGYKISVFVDGARSCDPHNPKDVIACMQKLREFHNYELEVDHSFDLFEEMEYYENLRDGRPSKFIDYKKTKENVYKLKSFIDSVPKRWILSHNDSVPGNFLLKDDKVYLIDWEYAAMQDPHVDIAMFALSAMYDRRELDQLLSYYFVEGYSSEIKYKIYSYMAIGGLLWSNWSEYKETFGVEFGEYSIKQYEAAKVFFDIVQKEYLAV